MGDPDAYQAGGALGALSRATQLANMQAANAANVAASLMRQSRPEAARPSTSRNSTLLAALNPPPLPSGPMQGPPVPPRAPLPVEPEAPVSVGRIGSPTASVGMQRMREGEPLHNKPTPPTSQVGSKGIQLQNEGGPRLITSGSQKLRSTIASMLEDIKNDPIPDRDKQQAAKEIADSFREGTRNKLFTEDELFDNPVVRVLNDTSVWSKFRRKVADFKARKIKVVGDDSAFGGNGTFAEMLDADDRTMSQALNSGNLPGFLVTRDQRGFLHIVDADQWVQGKYAEMFKDPKLAADVITALAMTSLYGSDSTADAQKNRVAVDREGNPVKAIPNPEDEKALGALAQLAAIRQGQGDLVTPDDIFAQVALQGRSITDQNRANGEYGSSGGGGGGRGGGGFGGGGGGGQSIRLTDPTALATTIDSIGRQRMGRSLTPAEQQAFINYFHSLERQAGLGYYGGGEYTPVDIEGQAVAWIQNQFQGETAGNQYGQLAAQFISMMGTNNPFGAMTS